MNTDLIKVRSHSSLEIKLELLLRDYQQAPAEFALEHAIVLLGLCPNAGKTEISIYVISEYLKANPTHRVLVFTHSTNVLKTNFFQRLEGLNVDFTYCTDFDPNCQVHICLPNSEKQIKGEYDFLIVDEAHENYFATRVQRIVKKVNPSKQLLLTGTPSKFIKKGGYKTFILAANEISDKWFAKLNIELVASNYNWKDNYNSDLEVTSKFKFNEKDTKKTLENVILKLIERIKTGYTPEQFNNPGLITKLKSWAFTYNEIGKTIIMCKRKNQADMVYKILLANGVDVRLSHSDNDGNSDEVSSFKESESGVLVVVNRGRLGYSDDSLMNIIDMSGTHNPDLIYQIFARALRGAPDDQKYYLKVTPQEQGQMDLTHVCVCAALMLTDRKYLSTYNGSNFNGIFIPVIKPPPNPGGDTGAGGNGGDGGNTRVRPIHFPELTNDIIDSFKNVLHNLDNPASIYKMTTIGEVRYMLGLSKKGPAKTIEQILENARGIINA